MNALKGCKLVSQSDCGLRMGQSYHHNVVFLYHYETINSTNVLN